MVLAGGADTASDAIAAPREVHLGSQVVRGIRIRHGLAVSEDIVRARLGLRLISVRVEACLRVALKFCLWPYVNSRSG